jgi:hypothetical protein
VGPIGGGKHYYSQMTSRVGPGAANQVVTPTITGIADGTGFCEAGIRNEVASASLLVRDKSRISERPSRGSVYEVVVAAYRERVALFVRNKVAYEGEFPVCPNQVRLKSGAQRP